MNVSHRRSFDHITFMSNFQKRVALALCLLFMGIFIISLVCFIGFTVIESQYSNGALLFLRATLLSCGILIVFLFSILFIENIFRLKNKMGTFLGVFVFDKSKATDSFKGALFVNVLALLAGLMGIYLALQSNLF